MTDKTSRKEEFETLKVALLIQAHEIRQHSNRVVIDTINWFWFINYKYASSFKIRMSSTIEN